MKIKKFFQIKNYVTNIKNNDINIDIILKQSRLNIEGVNNSISIKKSNLKRLKIGIYGNNNYLEIDKNCTIRDLNIIIQGNNLKLIINKDCNIGGAHIVCGGEDNSIIIEENCLLASGIEIRNNDGHSIFENNKVINESKDILIQKNVWVCENVKILKGTNIGPNSVVALNALLSSKEYEGNVILAGIPAKIIKRNISWSREMPN